MQRRQFLRNTLALGAAGLLPSNGLVGGVLGNLPQDATRMQSNTMEKS